MSDKSPDEPPSADSQSFPSSVDKTSSNHHSLMGVETLYLDDDHELIANLHFPELFSEPAFTEGEKVAVFRTENGIELVPARNVKP